MRAANQNIDSISHKRPIFQSYLTERTFPVHQSSAAAPCLAQWCVDNHRPHTSFLWWTVCMTRLDLKLITPQPPQDCEFSFLPHFSEDNLIEQRAKPWFPPTHPLSRMSFIIPARGTAPKHRNPSESVSSAAWIKQQSVSIASVSYRTCPAIWEKIAALSLQVMGAGTRVLFSNSSVFSLLLLPKLQMKLSQNQSTFKDTLMISFFFFFVYVKQISDFPLPGLKAAHHAPRPARCQARLIFMHHLLKTAEAGNNLKKTLCRSLWKDPGEQCMLNSMVAAHLMLCSQRWKVFLIPNWNKKRCVVISAMFVQLIQNKHTLTHTHNVRNPL